MWKTLTKAKLIDSLHLIIYREKVQTQCGQIIEDYYISIGGDVAMIAVVEDDKILMIREYKHGCRDYVWQLPAGVIGDGEPPLEAAKRELLEETGYTARSWKSLGDWYINPPRTPDRLFIFVMKEICKVQDPEPDISEEIAVKWIHLEEALKMVLHNEIKDPHSCIAIIQILQADRGELHLGS